MLKVAQMKDPISYEKALSQKKETMRILGDIKVHVVNGKKREDEESAMANAKGIPKLRIKNASFTRQEAEPSDEIARLYAFGGRAE